MLLPSLRRLFVLLVLVLLMGSARTTHAQTEGDSEQARSLVLQGNKLYQAGEFQEALNLYQKAYRLTARPGTLFNMAQCERHLGHHRKAIFLYGSYLRAAPEAANRAQVQQLIEELQKLAGERRREPGQPAEVPTVLPRAPEGTVAVAPTPVVETAPSRPWYRRWYVWAAVGAVVAGAAVGGAVGGTRTPAPTPMPTTAFGEKSFFGGVR